MFNFFKPKLKLVTHLGTFHADEVFATAALSILLDKRGERFEVIRTRDQDIIKSGDIVYDVGGVYDPSTNRFDHHHKDFSERRANRITYSSFGLIWKTFGEEICGNNDVAKYVDEMLVEQIDATDNGMTLYNPTTLHLSNYDISSVVGSFSPAWDEPDSMENFMRAVDFAKHILKKEIAQYTSIMQAKEKFKEAAEKSKDKRFLILEESIPRYFFNFISPDYPELLYVVYPSDHKWKVFALRKKAGSFELRKDLPKEWGGLFGEELAKVTGVKDAEFCHRGLFLAVVGSKEGGISLAKKAVEN